MSAPLERWTAAKELSGTEARAAELFSKVLPPEELSEATQARHLAALREAAAAPRRFRIPAPVAAAVLFGGSMAFAAAQPAVRTWVREQMEVLGVLQPAPGRAHPGSRSATPAVQPSLPLPPEPVAAAEPLDDGAVVLEELDVRLDAGPVKPKRAAAAATSAPSTPVAAVKAAPATIAVPVAAAAPAEAGTPDIPDLPKTQTPSGALSQPDLPDMRAMPKAERIEVFLQRGDLDEAEELVGELKGDFSDKMTLLRGEVLHARNRCREANVYFTAVIKSFNAPDALLERALYGRAVCHASLGDGAASHADIDTHVSKFPNGRFKATDERLHRR
jgi:hypothetical protein